MTKTFFSQEATSRCRAQFQQKISKAMAFIESNHSPEARKTLSAIKHNRLTFRSYDQLTKDEYENCRADLDLTAGIDLPDTFPPTAEAVSQIERYYPGSIYGDIIYLSSKLSASRLALIIVHELCHYRLHDRYLKDVERFDEQTADFLHEARAVAAEYCFEYDMKQLTDSDIEEVYADTCDRYPEFVNDEAYDACLSSFLA